MDLASLKRGYAQLAPAQRGEFDAWARSLRNGDSRQHGAATQAHSGRVQLQGGSGTRAQWNGTCATVVPGTRRNGWVDVDHPSAKRMPWRHRGCNSLDDGVAGVPTLQPDGLPTEIIALVFARLELVSRMRLLTVCKAWAACAEHSSIWDSIVTPQSASEFSPLRLARLFALAGSSLRELDLGFEAGLRGWRRGRETVNLLDLTYAEPPVTVHPAKIALMRAAPWGCLGALRVRAVLPWLPASLLSHMVSQCTAIQDVDLVLPQDVTSAQLRKLCRPTLRSLRLKFSSGSQEALVRDQSDTLVTAASLPITNCPQLHTLYLSDVVHGRHHTGRLLYGAPPSLKTLKLLLPSGGLMNFEPDLPSVEHLHFKLLKTYPGFQFINAHRMCNLRTLHFKSHQYGPLPLGPVYVSLVGCTHLAYLRVDLQGAYSFDGNAGDDIESLKLKLRAVMELPEMWFCEAPHQLPTMGSEWEAIPVAQPPERWLGERESDEDSEEGSHFEVRAARMVHTQNMRKCDEVHLARLLQNADALLPVFNQEQHPELAAALEAEAVEAEA